MLFHPEFHLKPYEAEDLFLHVSGWIFQAVPSNVTEFNRDDGMDGTEDFFWEKFSINWGMNA